MDEFINKIPNYFTIENFILLIVRKANFSENVLLLALIYIDRYINETRYILLPNTYRPIVVMGLLLAHKFTSDLSMGNNDF